MNLLSPFSFFISYRTEARMPASVARPIATLAPVEPFPYVNVRSTPSMAPVDSPSGNALFRPGQSTALPIPSIISRADGKPVSFESWLPLADILKLIPFETSERLTLLRYLPAETKLLIPESVYKNAWAQYNEIHNEPYSWQRPEVQWIYLSLALDEYLVTRTSDLAEALHSPAYTLHDYSIDYRNDPLFLNHSESPEDYLMQNTPLWRVNKEEWVDNKQANEILRRVRKGERSVEEILREGVMITGGEEAAEVMISQRKKADEGAWFNFLAELAKSIGNEGAAGWLESLARNVAATEKQTSKNHLAPVASNANPSRLRPVSQFKRLYPRGSQADTFLFSTGRSIHASPIPFINNDEIHGVVLHPGDFSFQTEEKSNQSALEILKKIPSLSGYFQNMEDVPSAISYGKTSDGHYVLQQTGWRGCGEACAMMIAMDHGKELNVDLLDDGNISFDQMIVDYLEKDFGLHTVSRHLVSDNVGITLESFVKEHGSSIVSVSGEIGGHYLVIDSFSLSENRSTIRDPYHGWCIEVTAEAILKRGPEMAIAVASESR